QEKRYWYSTQPSVARLAQDRAAQLDGDTVLYKLEERLRAEQNTRGSFARVHACPASSGDIPDERDTRLVILRPSFPHAAKDTGSPAMREAAAIFEQHGNSPRYKSNALVFLAPDRTRLDELEQAMRQYLAWKSIEEEQEILNLDAFQRNQAKTRREHTDSAVKARIPEAYTWVLVPESAEPGAKLPDGSSKPVAWREIRLQPSGQEALAVRASRKLENDGLLITKYAGTNLRLELDKVPLWRGDAVSVKQLADDFAQYLYLPRLRDTSVLLGSVAEGVASLVWERDTFAYADSYDAARHRYLGLMAGQQIMPSLDGLLVRPEVAAAQLATERAPAAAPAGSGGDPGRGPTSGGTYDASENGSGLAINERRGGAGGVVTVPPAPAAPTAQRFYGSVTLDSARAMRDATAVIQEVVQHLSGLLGAKVEVTLEVHAELPQGAPEHVIRTVTENCRTLKFTSFGFEGE
ncbi:MAG: AAA+ family ATPase, partial [Ktedonobacterales bacterium]